MILTDKNIERSDIMNHEILFRGKRLDNDEWVYGVPVSDSSKTCIISLSDSDELKSVQVIPETVGQFTGFYDRKGNGICVDDIVIYRNYRNIFSSMFLQVKWVDYFGMFTAENGEISKVILLSNINRKVEIISNIHDNPEWLKRL